MLHASAHHCRPLAVRGFPGQEQCLRDAGMLNKASAGPESSGFQKHGGQGRGICLFRLPQQRTTDRGGSEMELYFPTLLETRSPRSRPRCLACGGPPSRCVPTWASRPESHAPLVSLCVSTFPLLKGRQSDGSGAPNSLVLKALSPSAIASEGPRCRGLPHL